MHARTHAHTHTQKAKPVAAVKHGHAYPDRLGHLCTRQALRSQCRQILLGTELAPREGAAHASWMMVVPPGPQPLSETCTTWHLIPQLFPGPHWYGWVDWSHVSKASCSKIQQQRLGIELATSQSANRCSNHEGTAASPKHTHMHIYAYMYVQHTRAHIQHTHTHTHTSATHTYNTHNTHTHTHTHNAHTHIYTHTYTYIY